MLELLISCLKYTLFLGLPSSVGDSTVDILERKKEGKREEKRKEER